MLDDYDIKMEVLDSALNEEKPTMLDDYEIKIDGSETDIKIEGSETGWKDDYDNQMERLETGWKAELNSHGHATCIHPKCQLCFLSIKGIVDHNKICNGFIGPASEFVNCFYCNAKFKQFKSAQTHMVRYHQVDPQLMVQNVNLDHCSKKRVHQNSHISETSIPQKDNDPQPNFSKRKRVGEIVPVPLRIDPSSWRSDSSKEWKKSRVCEKELESAWKEELKSHGHATCIHPKCQLSYLTISGIILHNMTCPGHIRPSDCVECIYCEAKFKTSNSCQSHMKNYHHKYHHKAVTVGPHAKIVGIKDAPCFDGRSKHFKTDPLHIGTTNKVKDIKTEIDPLNIKTENIVKLSLEDLISTMKETSKDENIETDIKIEMSDIKIETPDITIENTCIEIDPMKQETKKLYLTLNDEISESLEHECVEDFRGEYEILNNQLNLDGEQLFIVDSTSGQVINTVVDNRDTVLQLRGDWKHVQPKPPNKTNQKPTKDPPNKINQKPMKDPIAPKKPMSAYFLFCQDGRGKVKAENPEFGILEVAKEMGRRWATIDPGLKQSYEQQYQAARKVFNQQIHQKKKKDPNAPKWPLSSYFIFTQQERQKIKVDYPTITLIELGRELGRRWANIDPTLKAKYQNQADKARLKYEKEMVAYGKGQFVRPDPNEEEQIYIPTNQISSVPSSYRHILQAQETRPQKFHAIGLSTENCGLLKKEILNENILENNTIILDNANTKCDSNDEEQYSEVSGIFS